MEWFKTVKEAVSVLAGGSPESIVLTLILVMLGFGFAVIKVARVALAYHRDTVARHTDLIDKKDQALAKCNEDLVEVITETNGTLGGLQQAFHRIEVVIMTQLGRK